jgi:cytoskeletal protein CcmA (bactofilin family)
MFKRSEPETTTARTESTTIAFPEREASQQPRVQATIGATIHIKGDVTGEENLTIEGTVEGTVTVKQHSLQVGKNGRVNADVYAKIIRIEGNVEGNLHAEEQVVVRTSGVVRGNIVSPRLTMEDGCSFKGSVDMEARGDRKSTVDAGRKPAGSNGSAGLPHNGSDKPAGGSETRIG